MSDSHGAATTSAQFTISAGNTGDGLFGDSTALRPTFTYTKPGKVRVRLRLTDGREGSATASVAVQPRKK